MRINHKSYQKYVKNMEEILFYNEIYSPILINNETFMFPLMNKTRDVFVISLNHSTPLSYIISNDIFFSSFENSFIKKYRKYYGKSIVFGLKLDENDNILTIDLKTFEEEKPFKIIVELFPNSPNLLVIENDVVVLAYYSYKNHPIELGKPYKPIPTLENQLGEQQINDDFINEHFNKEIQLRSKEKYAEFNKYLNSKINKINRKVDAIKQDVINAEKKSNFKDIADQIYCLDIDFSSHLSLIEIDGKTIELNKEFSISDNCQKFYKIAKKARETIEKSQSNLENAQKELDEFTQLKEDFENMDEKDKDKLLLAYNPNNKKHETTATSANKPWKYNLNGSYIYFGKNASQNDYLSFVMKTDREFTWLHIKNVSGSHLIICNKKPTENELLFACEFALICSHCKTGEIVYTKKKNVRKGHVLGEAILKNYSTIKLNRIREETVEAFKNAKRFE